MTASFGELRSIAQSEPGVDSWGHLCALLDRAPAHEVREVLVPYLHDLLDRWPDAARVVSPVWLGKIGKALPVPQLLVARSLDLRAMYAGATLLGALGTSRELTHIRQVYASGRRLGPAGIRALLGHGAFPSLEVLHLDDASLSDDGVDALCQLDALRGVRELSLTHNTMGPDAAESLASSPWLESLEDLDVSSNALGTAGLRRLAAAPWAPGLRALRISFDRAGWGAGIDDTFRHDRWTSLRELVISGAYSCPGLSRSLAGSTTLRRLETLGLNWDLIGCDGAREIFCSHTFEHLHTLDLRRNLLRVPGATALAEADLPALREALLGHNLFGDEGARILERSDWAMHARIRL